MSIFLNKVMYPDPTTENLLKNQLSKIQTEIAHATILSGKKKKTNRTYGFRFKWNQFFKINWKIKTPILSMLVLGFPNFLQKKNTVLVTKEG